MPRPRTVPELFHLTYRNCLSPLPGQLLAPNLLLLPNLLLAPLQLTPCTLFAATCTGLQCFCNVPLAQRRWKQRFQCPTTRQELSGLETQHGHHMPCECPILWPLEPFWVALCCAVSIIQMSTAILLLTTLCPSDGGVYAMQNWQVFSQSHSASAQSISLSRQWEIFIHIRTSAQQKR